jgi:PAS domain S-box-containing protein
MSSSTPIDDVHQPLPSLECTHLALSAGKIGIWEWDLASQANRWSDEIWQLFGLPAASQAPCFELWLSSIHPNDRGLAHNAVLSASQQLVPFELEWRTNPELGPSRWILSRGQPAPDQHGHASRYCGIVMDITERKSAEQEVLSLNAQLEQRIDERAQALSESERLLTHILDGVPGLVGYWTRELSNLFANKSYGDWFGMTPQEIKGRHIQELLGPELFARNEPHITAVLRGVPQCFERELPIPDHPGETRQCQVHYLPDVVEGQTRGFLVMMFDITALKQAEREAKAASQAKSAFLASISHELRTPLNAMFGMAQVGAAETTDARAQRSFRHIVEAGQHLMMLIDDVLDFSKIEAGKMHLNAAPVDVGQLLHHVVSMTHLRAEVKGLRLRIEESARVPRHIMADATRLSQVILNLLINAIKFSTHGDITLVLDHAHGQLQLDVVDQGVGMTPEQQERLFKPFEQGPNPHALPVGGTGLGLAISQRLVTLMQGELQLLHSHLGKGSQFRMRLPAAPARPAGGHALQQVALIGLPPSEQALLSHALRLRGIHIATIDQLSQPDQTNGLLLIEANRLQSLPIDRLNDVMAAGCHVVLHSPASADIAEAHGYAIDAVRINGPLSALRLMHAMDQAPRRHTPTQPQRLPGMRILAAEDNPMNRLVLEQMLQQEGAEVTFAFDGAQALEQVLHHGATHFDIVLCDIQMPVMDGYEATSALRTLAPDLPVIGLTAHAFNEAREQASRAGMLAYLTKPVMLDTLVSVIHQHARRGAPQETRQPQMSPAELASTTSAAPSDWDSMLKHFYAQPTLLTRLIETLADTMPGLWTQLEQARREHDIQALFKLAHNLKGTALNLHAIELGRLATLTQEQAREHHTDMFLSAKCLADCLREFMSHLPIPNAPQVDTDSIDQAIRPEVTKDGGRNLFN